MTQEKCPCGKDKEFSACCDRYISGKQAPPTPEALMRSRYSAYTKANIPYIQKTMKGRAARKYNPAEAYLWAKQTEWLGLTLIDSLNPKESIGHVEFIARFRSNNKEQSIHERSEFHLVKQQWYYVDGKML